LKELETMAQAVAPLQILKKSARIRFIVIPPTLKKHQKKFFKQLFHSLFYKKLTKERWNMVL